MRSKYAIAALVVVTVTGFLAGAVFSGEGEEKGKAGPPQPPPPPAELKALDAFVGQWRSTYEFTPAMFGEAGKGTGVTNAEWVLNGRFVMSRFKGSSSLGDYEWIGMMTYDPMTRTYRSFEFGCYGECTVGTMTYDADTKAWTTVSDGFDMSGRPAKNKVTMHFIGKDKLEWSWFLKSEGETEFVQMMKGTDSRITREK